ncbi:CobB/CobQ domain protein glutamine amidotransferase (fragment) [Nitrolancea hollandica Lb]|uniref:CobB/CobQ domain protein glutamine amidotransferase n=1 Tax=Nitrolancea hollandica Lb TaxID=1129897 RepID=I4EF33_9BACT
MFDAWTNAGRDRFIGNIVVDSEEFGPLVGFENHSGRTYLGPTARPLGHVRTGHGNNGADQTEGCRYRNAIGCYLHGALLPKNPALADFLIRVALEWRYGTADLPPIDDRLETAARLSAIQRAAATAPASRGWRR